jgi:hypothetical protein
MTTELIAVLAIGSTLIWLFICDVLNSTERTDKDSPNPMFMGGYITLMVTTLLLLLFTVITVLVENYNG